MMAVAVTKEDIGKRITFRVVNGRGEKEKATRVITHVDTSDDRYPVGVTYDGFRPFWVRSSKIISIEGELKEDQIQ
jgi:cytochrome c-type biogenesis protein CcmE